MNLTDLIRTCFSLLRVISAQPAQKRLSKPLGVGGGDKMARLYGVGLAEAYLQALVTATAQPSKHELGLDVTGKRSDPPRDTDPDPNAKVTLNPDLASGDLARTRSRGGNAPGKQPSVIRSGSHQRTACG